MSKDKTTIQLGPGFMGLLGLLFIGLKLTGYINWSWWLVLLPIYGPLVLILIVLTMILLFAAIASMIDK